MAVLLGFVPIGVQESGQSWTRLSEGHEPATLAALLGGWNAHGGPRAFRVDGPGTGIWVDQTIPASAWVAGPEAGEWRVPESPSLRLEAHRRFVLRCAAEELTLPTVGAALPRGRLEKGELRLWRAPGAPSPGEARLSSWFERGAHGRVPLAGGADSIEDGLVLWPGESFERRLDLAPGSVLRFTPRVAPLLAPARVTFRVWLEDELLYEAGAESAGTTPKPVVLALGAEGRSRVRLRFAVEGEPALTAFARPLVGPAQIGVPGARPFATRPDVVLFLADTFRADLLQLYGGEAGLTPHLDALAQRSVRFLEARSSSTWTLPAHASLFTGTWPPQHGAEQKAHTFPAEFDTLAELYQRAGYRTGALTDGLYVSRSYGMDQGFESFVTPGAEGWSLARTLAAARAFVEADDGRPLFLFVHSYRTHWPYRVGPEEDKSEALALRRKTLKLLVSTADAAVREAELVPAIRAMHALYRRGAQAFDAEFGPWFAALDARGLFTHGYFVFTSDHGEAFGEHGTSLHGGLPYEEQARVPLFVYGGGEAARAVAFGASSVDLAPTLAARCGLERSRRWAGRDLFALDEERMLFSCALGHDERLLGVTEGPLKLLARGAPLELPGSVFAAHALDSDRAEAVDLGREAPAVQALAARAAAVWRSLAAPLSPAIEVELDELQLDELRELGY